MTTARGYHTATLLPNGKVLIAGGESQQRYVASAELYNPATGTFTATGSMNVARGAATATLLPDRQVLIVGGNIGQGPLASAELYALTSTPTISWPQPADITYGTPLGSTQLNATADVPGTFTYSPPAGTVLGVGAGKTLSVTFTPDDTTAYTSATASVSINVVKATPSVTWPTPAPIVYGTAAGPAQLNATASVAGTFTSLATGGDSARCRDADAVGDIQSNRYGRLQRRNHERRPPGDPGGPEDRVDAACRDHLRDTARRRTARRDRRCPRKPGIYTPAVGAES